MIADCAADTLAVVERLGAGHACTSSSGQRSGARSTVSSQQRPAVQGSGILANQRLAHHGAQAEGMDPTVLAAIAGNVARHLPRNADPRLARVTLEQLPTMTSRLAGDDPSLGGDPRISQRKGANRDWVGHILGRRLASDPGASFAIRRPIDGLARPLLQWVAEPARRPP